MTVGTCPRCKCDGMYHEENGQRWCECGCSFAGWDPPRQPSSAKPERILHQFYCSVTGLECRCGGGKCLAAKVSARKRRFTP